MITLMEYLTSRLAPMGGEVQSIPQLENYKVSRPLGHGAMGMVLEVTWMGHQCGLKISNGSDKNEATILDRLHHPNIVRFFHYWEVPPPDRNSYMVMELLPSDLQKHISRELSRPSSQSLEKCVGMPFLLSVAIDLMLQVAQAMQHVHDQKLTHRDLKTSNILVKPVAESMSELHSQGYLEVKLADFGLAKGYLDSSISEGLTRNTGTTVYGAPEIFGQEETQTHKNFPPKADVWSFGMVCWEILTGRIPFSEETSKAELHKRIRFESLRPSFPKDCPVYLQFCISSCWELQPQRRPNFSDLFRMLRHAQLLNLGLIRLEDTGSWFGYSDRAGLVNTMSMASTSSEVESTKSWFRGGIGLISNFRNIGRGYKPRQPTIADSNDHTLQPTRDIVLAPGQRDNGNPLPQFKGRRNQGEIEEVGRKQARNPENGEVSTWNSRHEATEKLKEMAERMPQGPFKHRRSASLSSLFRLDIPSGAQGSSALDAGSEGSGLQIQQVSPSADNHGSVGNGVVSPSGPLSGRGSQGVDSPGIGAEVQSVRPTTRLGEGEMNGYDTGQRQEEGVRTSVTSLSTENGREPESEWVERDEPGVYITLIALPGGGRDLKRVRFGRKRFSEREAEQWWAENRVRVHEQYNVRSGIDRMINPSGAPAGPGWGAR